MAIGAKQSLQDFTRQMMAFGQQLKQEQQAKYVQNLLSTQGQGGMSTSGGAAQPWQPSPEKDMAGKMQSLIPIMGSNPYAAQAMQGLMAMRPQKTVIPWGGQLATFNPMTGETEVEATNQRSLNLTPTMLQYRAANGDPTAQAVVNSQQENKSALNLKPALNPQTNKWEYARAIYDPATKTTKPEFTGLEAPAPSRGQGDQSLTNIPNVSGTGEAALQGLPDQVKTLIRKTANYEIDPRATTSFRGIQRPEFFSRLAAYDPTYDQTQYATKSAVRREFTVGNASRNIRALNTAIGHIGQLGDAVDALNNGNLPVLNKIANVYKTQTGQSAPVVFDAIKNAVSGELATTFKGVSGTDQEIANMSQTIHNAQSPNQLRDIAKTYGQLLSSRLDALNSQYQEGMGKPADFGILNAKSAQILQKLGASGGQPSSQFEEGKIYQDASGRKAKYTNGQWQVIQ